LLPANSRQMVFPPQCLNALYRSRTGIVPESLNEACAGLEKRFGQAARLISTARLNPLLDLHLQPINVLVSNEPSGRLPCGRSSLGMGFSLRCFQRLSTPHVATQRCPWRDNWYTRGVSTPVLSY